MRNTKKKYTHTHKNILFDLLFDVSDTVRQNGEHGLSFGQARAVINLADASLSTALAKVEPREIKKEK